jgi:hypothetical protein
MNRRDGGLAATGVTVLAILVAGYTISAATLGIGFAIPVGIIGCIAGAVVLRGPFGKALAGRLSEGTAVDPAVLEEATAPLEAHIEELRGRMAELEERVDFAERLLTQQRETTKLGGGHDG